MRRLCLITLAMAAATAPWGIAGAQDLPATDTEAGDAEPELRHYTVELIVFAYAEDVSVGTEVFVPELVEPEQLQPGLLPELALDEDGRPLEGPVPDDSVPTSEATDTDPRSLADDADKPRFEYVLLAEEELSMLDTYDRLDRLDAYTPLMHVGWTQTALPEERTPALALPELGVPPDGLEGSFTLYLSRYLHLVVDLALAAGDAAVPDGGQPFVDPQGTGLSYEQTALQYGREYDPRADRPLPVYAPLQYAIRENRIVRSGELRYYDHPKFGVVAKIERFESADPEDPDNGDVTGTTRITPR